MDCSTPGLPVPHHLLRFAQIHVHCIGDAIQPSHPLMRSAPLPSVFPSIMDFSNESALHITWPKYWSFIISPSNKYSGLISFRIGSPCCPRDSQESSPAPQFKDIYSLAFSLLYSPALTTIHDYWEDHNLDYTDLCQETNVSAILYDTLPL